MTKTTLSPLFICLFCLIQFALVPRALADYYKYTDRQGVVSITNKLESVPAKYRSTMKVVRETPKAAPGAASQAQQAQPPEAAPEAVSDPAGAQEQAQAPAGKFAELSARFPWFKPLVYLAVILALFVAVLKVSTLLPSPLLSKAICIAFFLGVSVFLYKSYVAHVVESTARIKENASNMMKKSMVREQPVEGGAAAAEK